MSYRTGEWGDSYANMQVYGGTVAVILIGTIWLFGGFEKIRADNEMACESIGAKYHERSYCIKPDGSLWKMPEFKRPTP